MEFGVLGPLVVRPRETPVWISAGKQRVLLAALLLRANQVVAVDDLAEYVWDGKPPTTARVTMQNYVKRLRQALGPAGYERIRHRSGGYLIEVGPGELDLTQFSQLRAAGTSAVQLGRWTRASAQLGAALSLWRGLPLADVPSELLTLAEVPPLAEMRLDVLEGRIEADLNLGRHREVIVELQQLVTDEPLRERLHELLMLALYRSGQQSSALSAYQQVRRHLVDQVGVEPGPGLQDLHQRILGSDPALVLSWPAPARSGDGEPTDLRGPEALAGAPGAGAPGPGIPGTAAPASGAVDTEASGTGAAGTGAHDTGAHDTGAHDTGAHDTGASSAPVPGSTAPGPPAPGSTGPGPAAPGRQAADPPPAGPGRARASALRPALLPSTVPGFAGRSAELRALSAMLSPPGPAEGHPPVITVIDGMAGVGKTALAVHWAHHVAERFPDGQLYVNLRGFGPSDPMTPADALHGFLEALQVPSALIPASLEGQQGMYRSLLADRRMLILLDNARDASQVRPLLPGSPGSMALVTSRSQLDGLAAAEGARPLTLDVLTEAQARELLAGRIGDARLAAEPEAAGELIRLCSGLPLALAITAARAASRPRYPLTALVAELRDTRSRLDALATGEEATDMRAVFSWSYQNLRPAAARMFRLLGIHPGPDISPAAAASLAAVPVPQAHRMLRELTRCHLLTEPASGRYTLHDLLRAYAAEEAGAHESGSEQRAALHRSLEHYLHSAHGAIPALDSNHDLITLDPALPGTEPEHLGEARQALAWFSAERRIVLALITQAAEAGFDVYAWQLAWVAEPFFDVLGSWLDLAAVQHTALQAAVGLGDRAAQAHIHRVIGHCRFWLGASDDARAHLTQALSLYEELGDRLRQARVHHDLGRVLHRMGHNREALDLCQSAVRLYEEAQYRSGRARALNNAGWYHAHLGEYAEALACCRQALSVQRELGDQMGAAQTWDSIGFILHQQGDYAEAARCFETAADLNKSCGDRVHEARILAHLGTTHNAAGNPQSARAAWQQALDIFGDLYHPEAEQARAMLLALDATTSPSRPRPTALARPT